MPAKEKKGLFRLKLALFSLIVLVYLFFTTGLPWPEADFQLKAARNLLQQHCLSNPQRYYAADVLGPDGRWYDCHGITNILLMLPVAGLEGLLNRIFPQDYEHVLSFLGALSGVVINALIGLVFFSLLYLWGRPLKICLYTTLCLSFCSIVFVYAGTNYEGNLNMLFILTSLYFLFAFLQKNQPADLIFSGFTGGWAIATRDLSWIFLFCLCVFAFYVALKQNRVKLLGLFFVSLLPALIVWGYYNWLRSGMFYLSPIAADLFTGYGAKLCPTQNMLRGLKNLLLSAGGSIFAYSPILLLSLLGWKNFFKDKKREAALCAAIIVFNILYIAKMPEWFGLWCWGPRYTLEIAPLLMLPLAYWFPAGGFRNKLQKYAFIGLAAYSLLIQLAANLSNWHARVGHLLEKNYGAAMFYTAGYSQWYECLRSLLINMSNLFLGSFFHLEHQGYPGNTSAVCGYIDQTVGTWWNRLLFMGASPLLIAGYIIASLLAVTHLFRYIHRCLAEDV